MITFTLCDKKLNGDIPRYDFKDKGDALELVHHWLEGKDFEKSVFVCFENYRGLPVEKLRNEQKSLLVSHSWDDVTYMVETILDSISDDYDLDFAIFEYGSYQEALKYCIDLRESF